MSRLICLLIEPFFKPGDPPPHGYLQWHQWANVQMHARIRQKRCRVCRLWRFPQEVCQHDEAARARRARKDGSA